MWVWHSGAGALQGSPPPFLPVLWAVLADTAFAQRLLLHLLLLARLQLLLLPGKLLLLEVECAMLPRQALLLKAVLRGLHVRLAPQRGFLLFE